MTDSKTAKAASPEEAEAIKEMVVWLSDLNANFIKLGDVELQSTGTFPVVRKDGEMRSRQVFTSGLKLTAAGVTVGAREPVIFHFAAQAKEGHPDIDFKELQCSAAQLREHMPIAERMITRLMNRLGTVTDDKPMFDAATQTIASLVKGRKQVQAEINKMMKETSVALVKAVSVDAYADTEHFGSF